MMGLGSTVGAGVFVITGTVAANHAGPAVAISYLLACVLCLCPAACYAEFSAMHPDSAGAYGFSMASMGRGVAWLTGWLLLLEYLMAAATLAVGWSAYVNGFLEPLGMSLSSNWAASVFEWLPGEDLQRTGAMLNLPAAAIVLLIAGILCIGTQESSRITNVVVTIKIVTILAIIVVSTSRIDPDNWHPFLPANTGAWGEFGASGVLRGASIVFIAYLGFDVVSAVAREVSEPQRNVPRAIFSVVLICTILYLLMALAITGIAPSYALGVANPVALAQERAGLTVNAFRT
jgi:APA family basic amino acid/polyamine antiporter